MIKRRAIKAIGVWCLAAMVTGVLIASPAIARDAAFIQPGASNAGGGDEALKVEPKSDIDVGDTSVHMTRRTTLFFVNESNGPVQIEKMAVNSDANVLAEITNDDCSKQGTIPPASRCSVEVSITPSSPGEWSAEVLLTHNGAGRIARAKLNGKTSGTTNADEHKESGLAVSSKETNQVDFGELSIGTKAARSTLMVNDSPDPITLYSIDLIEANNGLKVLEGGCAVDMELKPGESCPVTIVWEPADPGLISTDLIIRHSGRKGFVVVPVRGKTKETSDGAVSAKNTPPPANNNGKGGTPTPPTADELDKKLANAGNQIPASDLAPPGPKPAGDKILHLIGTVGNRAVFVLPDGSTKIADVGDTISLGNDEEAKVTAVDAKSVEVTIGGKEKTIKLGAAPDLVSKAAAAQDKGQKDKDKDGNKNGAKSATQKASTAASSTPVPPASVIDSLMKGASP